VGQRRDQAACRCGRHLTANEEAIVRIIGTILLEQNDEWAVQRARCMILEVIAPLRDDAGSTQPAINSQLIAWTPPAPAVLDLAGSIIN
jgi:hypothetical protein